MLVAARMRDRGHASTARMKRARRGCSSALLAIASPAWLRAAALPRARGRARSRRRHSARRASPSSCAKWASRSRSSRSDADRPMNPASVMKLVTTFAALELLGRDYRWKTEAYLAGTLDGRARSTATSCSRATAIPKITIEQWQAFMGDAARAGARSRSPATWSSTARYFELPRARSGRVRPRAAAALQRRTGCAARQFQVGALRVRARCRRATRWRCASSRRCRNVAVTAAAARSSAATAATGAPRCARNIADRAHGRVAPRSPAASRRRAASATGTWRCSIIRTTSYGMFTTYFREAGGHVRRRPSRRPAAAHAARRSRCWNRRRSTTSCATSTSCRTT